MLLCTPAGATITVMELRGNPTVVRSDTKSENNTFESVGFASKLKVARSSAVKSEKSPQITKKKLSDASTIPCSCKPSHVQNNGAPQAWKYPHKNAASPF